MYRLASALPPAWARSSQASASTASDRHAGAEMAGSTQHRLAVRIATRGGAAPPADSFGRIARHAERIMVEHADPRHGRGDPLLGGGNRPAAGLRNIGLDHLAFEQHPAQHVLRRRVALFRGLPIELGRAADSPVRRLRRENRAKPDSAARPDRRPPRQASASGRQDRDRARRRAPRRSRRRYCSARGPRRPAPAAPRCREPWRGRHAWRLRAPWPCARTPALRPAGARGGQASASMPLRIETGEIGGEACLVFEAAQVEQERLVLDASDHRNRQPAQRRCERLRAHGRCPSAGAAQARRWAPFRAAGRPSRSGCGTPPPRPQTPRPAHRQHTGARRAACAAMSAAGRASSLSVGSAPPGGRDRDRASASLRGRRGEACRP